MRRREFITLLGGAAASWPVAARGQQPAVPVVGFLHTASPEPYAGRVRAFRQSLSDTGYVEGRDVAIEYRWANNRAGATRWSKTHLLAVGALYLPRFRATRSAPARTNHERRLLARRICCRRWRPIWLIAR
jgi:hypothetical protein